MNVIAGSVSSFKNRKSTADQTIDLKFWEQVLNNICHHLTGEYLQNSKIFLGGGPFAAVYRIVKHGRDTLEPSEDGNMKLRPMQNMVMPVMRRKMMLMYLQSTLASSRGDTRYPLVIVN